MTLYKYVKPARIDVLETGRIALTAARAFNDPFELNPHIPTIIDNIAYTKHIAERTRHFVILSLADNPESLLMWAHYAESHKGFLIGFDSTQSILGGDSPTRRLGAVVYSHYKPARSSFEDLTEQELFYWKGSEWVYEREWRLIDVKSVAEAPVPAAPGSYLFPFRPQAVKEVITGCKCSIALELMSILRRPQYGHVEFLSAVADRERYQLNFVHFPRSAWDHTAIDTYEASRGLG